MKFPDTGECPSCTRNTFELKKQEEGNAKYVCSNCKFGTATYTRPENFPENWEEDNLNASKSNS